MYVHIIYVSGSASVLLGFITVFPSRQWDGYPLKFGIGIVEDKPPTEFSCTCTVYTLYIDIITYTTHLVLLDGCLRQRELWAQEHWETRTPRQLTNILTCSLVESCIYVHVCHDESESECMYMCTQFKRWGHLIKSVLLSFQLTDIALV